MANKLNEHGQKIVPMTVEQQREHALTVAKGLSAVGIHLNGEVDVIRAAETIGEVKSGLQAVLEACMLARNGKASTEPVHVNGEVKQYFAPQRGVPQVKYNDPFRDEGASSVLQRLSPEELARVHKIRNSGAESNYGGL